jgi:hypothetical protein
MGFPRRADGLECDCRQVAAFHIRAHEEDGRVALALKIGDRRKCGAQAANLH